MKVGIKKMRRSHVASFQQYDSFALVKECLSKWTNGVCRWRLFHFRQSDGMIEVRNEVFVELVATASDRLIAVLAVVFCRDIANGKHGQNPRLCKTWFDEFFGNDMQKMAHSILLLWTNYNGCVGWSVVQEIDEIGTKHILKQHIVAHLVELGAQYDVNQVEQLGGLLQKQCCVVIGWHRLGRWLGRFL